MRARHPEWLVLTLAFVSMLLVSNGCSSPTTPTPQVDAMPGGNVDAAPGCPEPEALWDDIELADIQIIPELADLYLGEVTPADPPTYWELRFAGLDEPYRVIASDGELCADAADPADCMAAFRVLSSDTGFATGCLPGYCYYYVAVNRGDDNALITGSRAFIDFLGTIDNPTAAILAAFAEGYTWSASDPSAAGVLPVEDGFELLVTALVSDCDPVQSDRFLLFVSTTGAVEVRRQQIYSILCGACI